MNLHGPGEVTGGEEVFLDEVIVQITFPAASYTRKLGERLMPGIAGEVLELLPQLRAAVQRVHPNLDVYVSSWLYEEAGLEPPVDQPVIL
jgi:hypothetical protein